MNKVPFSFVLTSPHGNISYSPNDKDYTSFIKTAIKLLLANTDSIDPELVSIINESILAYDNNESIDFGNYEETEQELDFELEKKLTEAQSQAKNWEEAQKFISNLPDSKEFSMRILFIEESDISAIQKMCSKLTNFPPPMLHNIVVNKDSFVIPKEEAYKLYISLRAKEVIVSIKPTDTNIVNSKNKSTQSLSITKNSKKIKNKIVDGTEFISNIDRLA